MTAGKPLHRRRVPLTKWFLAIWFISTLSKGLSGMDTQSRVLARTLAGWLDVDYRTAWYMSHRIRRLLSDPDWRKLSGVVEADEMYIGGRKKSEEDDPVDGFGSSARGCGHGRTAVMVAAERGGDVRVRRIATLSSIEVGNPVRDLIDPSARLITERLPAAYRKVGRTMAVHVTVDHGRRCFCALPARKRSCPNGAGGHVNPADGLMARAAEGLSIGLFRRSVQGPWHWVSREHLAAYTLDCTWHHNRRDVAAVTKSNQALGGLDARPLGYREFLACG